MKNPCILFCSWKIRHAEPTSVLEETFRLHAAPLHFSRPSHSVVLDLRGSRPIDAAISEGRLSLFPKDGNPARHTECSNLAADQLPLAILDITGDDLLITHLLTRVERQSSHFIRPPKPAARCRARDLVQTLRDAFEANHIYLNNFECYYLNHLPGMALVQRVEMVKGYDYRDVGRRWYAALDGMAIDGFMPQLGEEMRNWSYDVEHFRVAPSASDEAGCVSLMRWSQKRKLRWDEPVATYRRAWTPEASPHREEDSFNQPAPAGSAQSVLVGFFDLPLGPVSSGRRTFLEISCESKATGNIFSVAFEDGGNRSDLPQAPGCEVRYVKTRGPCSQDLIAEELTRLVREIEGYLARSGLRDPQAGSSEARSEAGVECLALGP